MSYKFCPNCASKLISVEIEGIQRQRCPSCDFVHWDNPIPVVAAIVEHEGKVILTRNKGWPEQWVGIVAGFLEKDETPEEGALREVREELGLQGEIISFVGHYAFAMRNQIIFAYHIRIDGEIEIGDELESIKTVPPEEIRPWDVGTGPALKDWLSNHFRGKDAI